MLPTTSQTPPKDTQGTLSCSSCRYHIFGSVVFELEGTIVLTWFLKEVYTVSHGDPVTKVVLAFSEFQRHLWAGSWWQYQTIKLRYSHALLLVTASTLPWKCCHNTEADLRADAAGKSFSICASSQHRPTDNSSASWEGTGGADRTSGLGWWHHEKMNLDL